MKKFYRLRRISAVICASLIVGICAWPAPASAAAWAKAVYKPSLTGSTIEGWADVSTNCEGTFGCWTYVKLEYNSYNPHRPQWLNKGNWHYIAGH